MIKGILQYEPQLELYSVLYGWNGYAALIDQPDMRIRLSGAEEWQPWTAAPLASWIGKDVELLEK